MGPKRKRFDSSNSPSQQLDPSSKDKVEKLFQKKFTYSCLSPDAVLPRLRTDTRQTRDPEAPDSLQGSKEKCEDDSFNVSSTINLSHPDEETEHNGIEGMELDEVAVIDKQLVELKQDLNALKDELSDKDLIHWHEHTCSTNLAGSVVGEMKQIYKIELGTQAWSKFFEVASTFPIVPLSSEVFISVHLCEAPGAFIAALNHFLITQGFSGSWHWLGTTLNPYYEGNGQSEMIDDDRFIRATLDNWFFGDDETGNIMDCKNLSGLMQKMREEYRDVHLVTADGSIECANMPAEQETVVSHLHHCEVLTALQILSPGGAFVLKLFTMFETLTICLMYLLCREFEKVTVFKPATSKSGNSEVYVVCEDYRKLMKQETLDALCKEYFDDSECSDRPVFMKNHLPSSFLKEHFECCQYFTDLQSETIRTNIELFETRSEEQTAMLKVLQNYCGEIYFNKFNMKQIPEQCKVMHGSYRKQPSMFETFPPERGQHGKSKGQKSVVKIRRRYTGSLQSRQEQHKLPWNHKVALMEKLEVEDQSHALICMESLHPAEILGWRVTKGRPLQHISSSRFCDARFINQMNAVLEHAQVKVHREQRSVFNYGEIAGVLARDVCTQLITSEECRVMLDCKPELENHLADKFQVPTSCVRDQTSAGTPDIIVLSVVDLELEPAKEELAVREQLLLKLMQALQVLPEDGHLVLHLNSSVTFFTVGLLYILARAFRQVSGCAHFPGLWYQQVLYFREFQCTHHSLLEYLESVHKRMRRTEADHREVLEIIPKTLMIHDTVFTKFMKSLNHSLVGNFVNDLLDAEKELCATSDKTSLNMS